MRAEYMTVEAAEVIEIDLSAPGGIWPPRKADQNGLDLCWGVDSVPVRLSRTAAFGRQLLIKRVFDIAASLGALLFLMPLLLAVAIAIKLTSRGPVFFKQDRQGLHGRRFEILKFRSLSVEKGDPSGILQTVANDPRVTPVGRFIRRTSIDELPQLLNVLRGEMSLVGPRPHVEGMRAAGIRYDDLVPYYDMRLDMLPGMTGWAQANGLRGSTEDANLAITRIDHDIAYIQNFSFWLDIRIVIMTLHHEFFAGSGH
jgi:polysaccharide biosynthesis protein PslA